MSVQFTPLQPQNVSPNQEPVSLCAPQWTPDLHRRFPVAHREAVRAVLACHAREGSLLHALPKEVVVEFILPKMGFDWFCPRQVEPATVKCGDGGFRRKRVLTVLRAAARAFFGGAE